MDLIKAKTILSRLQSMHHSLEVNAQLSALERDLILNYLRELYEIYLETEVHALPLLKSTSVVNLEKSEVKEPVQKTLEFKFETEEPTKVDQPYTTVAKDQTPIPVISIEPIKAELTKPIKIDEPIPTPVVTQPERSYAAAVNEHPLMTKQATIPASIIELFDIKKGSELSDKLNELPLRDINRGIGINDRLELVNTLFGGQKQLFEQMISDLNSFKSFDEAQELLGPGPAVHYKWDHSEIREQAIDFIKLIRRRYL